MPPESAARYLVTGAAGFIGSHTCVELLEGGHEVVVLCRHAAGTDAHTGGDGRADGERQ